MKIRQVGAELVHAERYDEANSRVSQYCQRALTVQFSVAFELREEKFIYYRHYLNKGTHFFDIQRTVHRDIFL